MQTRQIQTAIIVSVLLSAASTLAEWRIFTTDDGLAVNSVTEILEDASGNMWFTNHRNWASRYDGVSWLTYLTEDNDVVRCVCADRAGNVWLAGYNYVSRYDGTSWETLEIDAFEGSRVEAIFQDSSGDMWFASSDNDYSGVSRFDGSTWTTYTTADGLPDKNVSGILEDRSGNLWFETGGGVS